jgi:glyoxylase-like metal-dependent hydrolase (beta-lactamase superfamily II)
MTPCSRAAAAEQNAVGGHKLKLAGDFYAYLWPGVTMQEMQTYGNNCNSYIRANALPGGKHVLIDPGMVANEARQDCLESLIAGIENDGLKVEDIGLIINTHLHPDHYGASEEIRNRSGCQVTIGEDEADFLKLMGGALSKAVKRMGLDFPEMKPDYHLSEGELRLSPDLVAEIVFTPGHSRGHIGVYWPDAKIFMGGDLIFYGSTGRVDIPGGDAGQLKESIEKVARLDIEVLLTGHQYGSPGILEGGDLIARNYDAIRRDIFPYL